jgi:hypothetical protein
MLGPTTSSFKAALEFGKAAAQALSSPELVAAQPASLVLA